MTLLTLMALFSFLSARPAPEVYGPQGQLSMVLTLPKEFDTEKDKCPLAILMHGFMSRKDLYPIPSIADSLAKEGIASIRFDFDAHGKSAGKFKKMTVSGEIADAKAIVEYALSLPFVTEIAFVGHSQGGVIAGMLAGELEGQPGRPACIVQLAPAAVLKDDALSGRCMNAKYDPTDPPESVNVFFHKLGRDFILEAQQLPIYETSAKYTGRVCLIHGTQDTIVPVSYSERYHNEYPDSELHLLEGEGHMLNNDKSALVGMVVGFLKDNLTK